jgi:hypothetical protein
MGTTQYFNEDVVDCGDKALREVNVEIGTTGYAGKGSQMYLKMSFDNDDDVGDSIILDDMSATRFINAAVRIGQYLGLKLE